jgi:hypothetical protein
MRSLPTLSSLRSTHRRPEPVTAGAAQTAAARYLRGVDALLPGQVSGFYLVGSAALGAYRERRSDIDFIAVLDGDPGTREVRRLRIQHARSALRTGTRALATRRSPLTGTCNGVFIRRRDLTAAVTTIRPIAAHCGHEFTIGTGGSDISPVAWKVFAERAITLRGPEPSFLMLDPQPELLAAWNLENLENYWRPWATSTQWPVRAGWRMRPRYSTAWGVLGAPRLHHTIATGEVVSKETAGAYALDVFPTVFHPLIQDAIAYWRHEPSRLRISPDDRHHRTTEFILTVIDSARLLEHARAEQR